MSKKSKDLLYKIVQKSFIYVYPNDYKWYREYHAKSHQRKRHISASRNDNLVLKKVPGRTFKPILSVLDKQIWFWKNNLHWTNEKCSIFEKNRRFSSKTNKGLTLFYCHLSTNCAILLWTDSNWRYFQKDLVTVMFCDFLIIFLSN